MAWSPCPAAAAAVASVSWGRAAPWQVNESGGSSPGCAPSSTGCQGDFNKRKASFVVLRSGRDPCKCFILPHRAGVIWGVFQHCCWLLQLLWLGFIIDEDSTAGDYWQRDGSCSKRISRSSLSRIRCTARNLPLTETLDCCWEAGARRVCSRFCWRQQNSPFNPEYYL